MAINYGNGSFSNRYKAFIISWTFLHNVTVYFGGYLILIYYNTKGHIAKSSLNLWYQTSNPEYWIVSGCVLGGLSTLVLGKKLGTKALLNIIRCIQLIAIIIVFIFYTLLKYKWAQNYVSLGIYPSLMLQGFLDSMSQISSPIYIMETICDRDLQLPVPLLLLVSTQLPLCLSAFISYTLSAHHLFLTFGTGVFGGAFVIVLLFSMFLPKSSQDGTSFDKDDVLTFWHLQFEKESGWLRPAASSLAICLLSQMTGFQMYEFYTPWSLRLVQFPGSELVKLAVPSITLILVLPFWTKNRLPTFLLTTTGIISVCLFLSGIVLHGLEGGSSVYPVIPFTIDTIFSVSYAAGLQSLTPIVCLILTPRRYRLAIFSIVITFTILDRRLVRTMTPTFIELLHPFGVFWLHAGAMSLGLLYIAFAIVDQLKTGHMDLSSRCCTVEEFITQV